MVRIFNKHKHTQQMMLAMHDDQSAMNESTELCNYIVSEVFKYVADDRKRQFDQLSTVPLQPAQVDSVEKMAGKILQRMKKERSESVPTQGSKRKNNELSFGKKSAQPLQQEDEAMESGMEQPVSHISGARNKKQADRERKREEKRLRKQ